MNHCKDCKYWGNYECSNPKFVYDTETPEDGVSYMDYEEYNAFLKVGPLFGCIHWAAK